jgi:hypothetical protein
MLNYFLLKYHLGMSKEEVDNCEGTLIDGYFVALAKINEKDGGGSKREKVELTRAFM